MPGPKRRTPTQVYESLFAAASKSGDCIIPQKKPMPAGYVQVLVSGIYDYAHRFVYEYNYGKIMKGAVVRHICHNKTCINPTHLAAGTHADNVADKVMAGRQSHGIGHYRSKLTLEQVSEIRADKLSSHADLSRQFGISRGGIKKIRDGDNWKTA